MEESGFVSIASLLCEPSRAKMLWHLLDGRAYTAGELAIVTDSTATAASNHLSKLLKGNIIRVDVQGRHRYYSFATPEVAYVVESLASLSRGKSSVSDNRAVKSGIKYCRTCYDHLAGYVGVAVVEALEKRLCLIKSEGSYKVTRKGWQWFSQFDIVESDNMKSRRPLTRQCLDWSERRPHLAGQLGASLLDKMLQDNWFRKVKFSRELVITSKGRQLLYDLLKITL